MPDIDKRLVYTDIAWRSACWSPNASPTLGIFLDRMESTAAAAAPGSLHPTLTVVNLDGPGLLRARA